MDSPASLRHADNMSFALQHLVDLALFAHVVELRSFTAAAKQAGMEKSAVSRRMKALERRLGVTLLRRTTRHVAVTTEGSRYYEHCARLLQSAKAADESVAADASVVRGRLRISAPVTFAQMYLTQAVAAFLLQYPEVDVQLVTEDRFVDVVADGFDLIIRSARVLDGTYAARLLAHDRLVVVGAPSYLDLRGRPTSAEDLVHHNCLHYDLVPLAEEWRFRARDVETGKSDAGAVAVRGNLSATDGTVLRQAVLSGLGLAVLPSFMVVRDVAEGRLEVLLRGLRRTELGIYAVTATSRGLPLRTRTRVDFLRAWFAKPEWERLSGPAGSAAGAAAAGTTSVAGRPPRGT